MPPLSRSYNRPVRYRLGIIATRRQWRCVPIYSYLVTVHNVCKFPDVYGRSTRRTPLPLILNVISTVKRSGRRIAVIHRYVINELSDRWELVGTKCGLWQQATWATVGRLRNKTFLH